MSATSPNDLIGSLRDLMSATTRADCVVRIEGHLERLYREYEPALVLDTRTMRPDGGNQPAVNATFELAARGRNLGQIVLNNGDALDDDTRRQMAAFVDHAALALDNARMLEDHERRARREACAIDRSHPASVMAAQAVARRGSLSAAGRLLFASSRAQKQSTNDADRLRKYLARHELSWAAIHPERE